MAGLLRDNVGSVVAVDAAALAKGDRMISRIRIEAYGATAAEVEATLKAAYSVIAAALDPGPVVPVPDGPHVQIVAPADDEMVIERDLVEPFGGPTAFKGRMRLLLNVASDSAQVEILKSHGVDVCTHYWDTAAAIQVGGVPTV